MDNRFNLIDEPWIPVADAGRVSLKQLFGSQDYRALGGNPVQKIAVLKLLLAIAQAAATPTDEAEWQALGSGGLARACLGYLDEWHDRFWLYGEKPFLQMPAINVAKIQSFAALLPDVSSGNTTVISQIQAGGLLDDGQKALLLLTQMGFALAGKKVDNNVVLSVGYTGKTKDNGKARSGKPGPSVAHMGLLHNFIMAATLSQTIWLNLLSASQVAELPNFTNGIGQAPWEQMPEGEDCIQARRLKTSLMGRLLPLGRFCLLTGSGVHFSEGIVHAGYKEGMTDLSTAINYTGKEPKALWTNPDKRPWRQLTALLGFLEQGKSQGFESSRLRMGLARASSNQPRFAIWSGGLRVSSNAGEQYVAGSDDFVESQLWLGQAILDSTVFSQFRLEMDELNQLAKTLYGRVMGYFKSLTCDGSKRAAQASHTFWQLCEMDAQELIDNCMQTDAAIQRREQLRRQFVRNAQHSYDQFCPKETARQLGCWAKNRPHYGKYLAQRT